MIDRLALFGATGDLAGRFLLPALAALEVVGRLPDAFELVGAGRRAMTDEAFRRHAAGSLGEHARDVPESARAALLARLRYETVDVADPASVGRLVAGPGAGGSGQPVAVYLALPPALFGPTIDSLSAVGLPPGSRIALEKPFGEDLASARALNARLARLTGVAGESAVFRVDHFLSLETVQNLLAMRLANRVMEPIWTSDHVERIEIIWDETLALEGRAEYFDGAGMLKDVLQNHLLQVLCMAAMEPPMGMGERDLRDRKLDVLRSVRPINPDEAPGRTRRARYTAGRLADGREVPSYVDEPGVDPSRRTETFAEVELELDSWRWSGTSFLLRAAKALVRNRKEVVVRFRPVPRTPFRADDGRIGQNELRLSLDVAEPADLRLRLTGVAVDPAMRPVDLAMAAELPAPDLPPYGRVLLHVLDGDTSLSVRGDEAEEAWRVVTPVLEAWAADRVPLETYVAGSDGPPPLDPDPGFGNHRVAE